MVVLQFIVAALLLGVAAWRAGVTHEFAATALRADGVVVELGASGSHPRISFTPRGGESLTYPQGGFIFGYRVGDRVEVLYRAEDPSGSACIAAAGALWFAPGLFVFLAAAVAAVAASSLLGGGSAAR